VDDKSKGPLRGRWAKNVSYKNSNAMALLAIAFAALVYGAFAIAAWTGVDIGTGTGSSASDGSTHALHLFLAVAVIAAVTVAVAYGAWLLLRRGVRTLSKDVRAGSEEARLESDILRARLAEVERRLEKDEPDE
jgi:hypothetical protein